MDRIGGEKKMKIKYIAIGIIAAVMLLSPSLISADIPADVTCTYYSFPLYFYACSDHNLFRTQQQMIDFYTPAMLQTEPDYTFVTGAATETFTP